MRIAYVLTQDMESPAGLGRYLPLARQLVRRGHYVHISALHPDFTSVRLKHQIIDGVNVNYVAPMHVRKQGNLKYYYGSLKLLTLTLRATWGLSIDTWRSDVSIIHVGKPHPMNSMAGLLGSLRSPGGLCVDCDDYEAASMHFSAAWQKILIEQVEKRVPKTAQLVTVNTQFMRSKLLSWGVANNKILYLPNGVDLERFNNLNMYKVEDMRQNFDLMGKRVVAFIGSISLPSHPLDLLLRAFSLVVQQRSNVVLLVVGGGGDYPTVKEMAARLGLDGSVIFVGRVAPQDVPLYYAMADVTIDPVYDNDVARSRLPLKLFESWASGVPFITSRVGDRIVFLEKSQAGVLTQDCTPEAYARAILDILSSTSLAEKLRDRGLVEVKQFTWEHLASQLEQAYQSLLAGNRPNDRI